MVGSTRKRHVLVSVMNFSLFDLPVSFNLSYVWNMGSLLGFLLVWQIVSGLLLASNYVPSESSAFESLWHIMRDVKNGWVVRSFHVSGASFFFICLYTHIGRGVYYGSYILVEVWSIGVVLLLMGMGVAFLGYVLPWGQMSFWGATVITSLFSALPYIGEEVVVWLWGGYNVGGATLNRFFILHFFSPFVMLMFVFFHLAYLHVSGSNNPLGVGSDEIKVSFHPYYSGKDFTTMVSMILVCGSVSFFLPHLFTEPDNFLPADSLKTPAHITPEWYFLWTYAILRAIPNKLGGVVSMFGAIMVLFFLPKLFSFSRVSMAAFPSLQMLFWGMVGNLVVLTWVGKSLIEPPYNFVGGISMGVYFLSFIMVSLNMKVFGKLME